MKKITDEELEQRVIDRFNELDTDRKVDVWREYCESVNDWDSVIYPMDDLDEILEGTSPYDILRCATDNDFDAFNYYFRWKCDELESSDYPEDWMYPSDLANDVVHNGVCTWCKEIEEVLEDAEEEEEGDEE